MRVQRLKDKDGRSIINDAEQWVSQLDPSWPRRAAYVCLGSNKMPVHWCNRAQDGQEPCGWLEPRKQFRARGLRHRIRKVCYAARLIASFIVAGACDPSLAWVNYILGPISIVHLRAYAVSLRILLWMLLDLVFVCPIILLSIEDYGDTLVPISETLMNGINAGLIILLVVIVRFSL